MIRFVSDQPAAVVIKQPLLIDMIILKEHA